VSNQLFKRKRGGVVICRFHGVNPPPGLPPFLNSNPAVKFTGGTGTGQEVQTEGEGISPASGGERVSSKVLWTLLSILGKFTAGNCYLQVGRLIGTLSW
jgi:hypothetical protein